MTEAVRNDDLAAGLGDLIVLAGALKKWDDCPWSVVQEMTRSVGPLILAQLVGRNLWDALTPCDQAAVHWAMAEGHTVSCVEEWRRPDREGPHIQALHETADYFASLCGARRSAYAFDRLTQSRSGAEFAGRFTALPEGWRGEVMRRALAGHDVASTVAQAAVYRNILRSVYGIDVPLP